MTHHDDLDRQLTAWLDDPDTPPAPRYLGEVLERTRRTPQRPAWASLERWLPMAFITRPATAPPMRLAWLLLITLLVLALAAGGAIVGSRLLTSSGPDDGLRSVFPIPQGGAAVLAFDALGDIFTMRADGTDRRQLTSGPDIESSPAWSPDGTRIAYRVSQGGSDSIAVMDGGGGDRKTLATAGQPGQDCIANIPPSWSPDGTSLVFAISAACDSRYDLFIVAADGSSPATRLLAPGMSGNFAAWSPDGTRIAFQSREATGGAGLYVVDVGAGGALAGGLEARRISDAGTYSSESWQDARWSPDGTEVVGSAGTTDECSPATSGARDIFAMKADGSSQRPLVAGIANEYRPTWSPDGRQLAFLRIVDASEFVNGRPCTVATWVADADGGNERRLGPLGPDPDGQPPFWSPDGTRLASYLSTPGDDQAFGLFVVTVDGSSPLVTVHDSGWATWQPLAAPLPPAPSFAPASATP